MKKETGLMAKVGDSCCCFGRRAVQIFASCNSYVLCTKKCLAFVHVVPVVNCIQVRYCRLGMLVALCYQIEINLFYIYLSTFQL